jgi:hypothetical protein
MPAGVALGGIYAALREELLLDADLEDLLAPDKRDPSLPGMYPEGAVPAGAGKPYLTIGSGTQIPNHTMGKHTDPRWGWDCTIQIKAVGTAAGEEENTAILDLVGRILYEGLELDVPAGGSPGVLYGNAWCDEWTVQPTLVYVDAGTTIRETPAIIRVRAHD